MMIVMSGACAINVSSSAIDDSRSINYFLQLGLNLSNGVTDTLESSTILIYLIQLKGIYTQKSH